MSIKCKPIYAIFASTLTLIACSGGSSGSSETVVATPAPTTIPATTTTTIDPITAAGKYYWEIVIQTNCARELFQLSADTFTATQEERWKNEFKYDENLAFEALRTEVLGMAASFANSLTDAVASLGTYVWPENVQQSIDGLISQMLEEASGKARFSKLSSLDEIRNWRYPKASDDTNYAGLIRAKLGLPSNVNNDMNYCKENFG